MEKIKRHGLSFIEMGADKTEESYIVAKELVENLFFDMSKLCTKYSNDLFHDMPYAYTERRIDSVILPVLSKLCNSMVFVEYPTTRQCSNRHFHVDKANGRIDYWCIYKNYSIVIELKHSFDCFTTSKTRERTVSARWMKMNEQLDSVEEEIKKTYTEKTKGVIRIGLHIITSYSDKRLDKSLITQFRKTIPNMFERFSKDVSKRYSSLRPDIIVCWKIPEKIVLKDECQTFPGLWALAKIYSPIPHFGRIR